MITGTVLDFRPSPAQFAVRTGIDPTTIAGWLADIIKECREYATNLLGMHIFTGNPEDRITPRGTLSSQTRTGEGKTSKASPRFLTISREVRSMHVSLISLMYTEILSGIIYLHHRAFELEDLIIFSSELASRLSGEVKTERARLDEMIDLWLKAFLRFIERNMVAIPKLAAQTSDIETVCTTKSLERFEGRLELIRNSLTHHIEDHGRYRPLILVDPAETIIIPHADYKYPLGASFFELVRYRISLGLGYSRIHSMLSDLQATRSGSPIPKIFTTMIERFAKDIKEHLIPSLKACDSRIGASVEITNTFIERLARLLANHIIDMALSYFNFAVSFTDRASGTTIQLRAFKTILCQTPPDTIIPLTPEQIELLDHLAIHVIRKGTGK